MQICKASWSEKREPVEMVQGFKSWSSLCESDSNGPRLTMSVWRPHYCIQTGEFSVIYRVLNSWAAELCFSWRQIKPCLRGPLITNVCFINSTQWVTGTKAALHFSLAVVPQCWQSWLVYLLCLKAVLCAGLLPHSRLPPFFVNPGKFVQRCYLFLNTRGQCWQRASFESSTDSRLPLSGFCFVVHRRTQDTTPHFNGKQLKDELNHP